MNIPYTSQARPSTGLTNAKLGMMLFIASEVMLFGALMTSYVFLRTSYDGWTGNAGILGIGRAVLAMAAMAGSSAAMALALSAHRRGRGARARAMLAAALALGAGFIAITAAGYADAFGNGTYPSTSTFAAIYFVLTGLHALHVAGGVVALGLLLGPWSRSQSEDAARFDNRVSVTGLYWHFLAAVSFVTIPVLYLA
jgi:heme/copper-type cytochrome/quinol oxidase subunit 3